MRNSRDFTLDYNAILKDAGLIAASAAATVGGAARRVDLGTGRVQGRIIIDISACEVDTGNEKYEILARVSNSATMASGVFIAGELRLGHSSVSLESASSSTGRRELHFTNEINGTTYQYLELYTVVAGTVATGINYTGFLVK